MQVVIGDALPVHGLGFFSGTILLYGQKKFKKNFTVRVRLGQRPSFPHPQERHHPLGSRQNVQNKTKQNKKYNVRIMIAHKRHNRGLQICRNSEFLAQCNHQATDL